MSYIKSYSFIKRTFVLLSPLFLVTLVSKELAFYSPSATLSPILSNPEEAKNSIINLVSRLHQDLPEEFEDYGSLKVQKTDYFSDLWIEETNSLATFSHNSDFKFKEADKIITKDTNDNENKYVLKKANFKEIEEKGDINVLITFDLTARNSDPIQITHVVPLADLTTSSTKVYTVVTTKLKEDENSKKTHTLIVAKDEENQQIIFKLNSLPNVNPSNGWFGWNTSEIVIKSFYILFNDSPPLDPTSYFSIRESEANIIGDSINSKFKKVLLNRWKNSNKSNTNPAPQEPIYEFNISNDFWSSTCSDPYKVGGFIDEDLKAKDEKQQQQESSTQNIESVGNSRLAKQKKSWIPVKPNQKEAIKHEQQYYWKQIQHNGHYVPHDESTTTYDKCFGVEEHTKTQLKQYIDGTKPLTFEPKNRVQKKLSPVDLTNGESISSESKYPKHKIVQSSFRAWGNAYLTKWGENLKQEGKYSKQFELANQSNHTFTIKIPKATWTEFLTKKKLEEESKRDKKLNQNPDISSLLEVSYPLSFSFFDPISSHLKKHSLLLKTELDLSHLYLNSFFSKEVFRFDIERENRVIGQDYQGFDPHTNHKKKKDYGLDGILSLIAGLELDIEKNLKINLTTRVSGFVNTKNPSCDLRHRLYKIKSLNGDWNNLESAWRCSQESGWKYREHIHIPSFLIISLTGEPEVNSFYIDRQSGVIEEVPKKEQPVNRTLSELNTNLATKPITKIIETNESNNAEVHFKDIAVYERPKETDGFPLLEFKGWWSNGQNVYYWYPRRAKGKLTGIDLTKIKSITLYLDGSKNSYNSFFHSNHFNTLTTVCVNNKYKTSANANEDCADEGKYDKSEKDKNPSELNDLWGSQKIDIEFKESDLKQEEKEATEIKVRVTYNRADRRNTKKEKDNYDFATIKGKLETFFKTDTSEPQASQIPDVSMLAFWYSVFLWKDKNGKDLHYATQVRPIGLITQEIKNSTSHYTVGAAGSAGFQISKFELHYS